MANLISIIVSSYRDEQFYRLEKSVAETIGYEYEIIKIPNKSQYSLCAAYNIGISEAKGDFLCFVHEDVEFLVYDWGKHCVSLMKENKSIGLIGVAGSAYKTILHGSWFSTYTYKYHRGRICQGNNSYIEKRLDEFDIRENKIDQSNAVIVDGVFMFTNRNVVNEVKFDEKRFTGFHVYDMDFSVQVFLRGYKVIVDRDIFIFHYSQGNFNSIFAKYARKFTRKYWSHLPLCSENISLREKLYIEIRTFLSFIKHKIRR